MSTVNAARSGLLFEAFTWENIDKIHYLIMDYYCGPFECTKYNISLQNLFIEKLIAKWVRQLLSVNQKRDLAKCFKNDLLPLEDFRHHIAP